MKVKFVQVMQDRKVTPETDPEFWLDCQRGVLLALKELGLLNETQCRSAEEILWKQSSAVTRKSYD